VLRADTGDEALRRIASDAPDVVVLDLGLPDIDGKDVIGRVREWSDVPIVVLSARDREAEKVAALDRGADDFVNKPFGVGELMARLRAALRHRMQRNGETPVVRIDGLEIDVPRRRVCRDGQEIKLTPKEFELIAFLARYAGKVVTHKQVLTAVWGPALSRIRSICGSMSGSLDRRSSRTRPSRPCRGSVTASPNRGTAPCHPRADALRRSVSDAATRFRQ
jgi:two-component system KDP operon response regulator KdpE